MNSTPEGLRRASLPFMLGAFGLIACADPHAPSSPAPSTSAAPPPSSTVLAPTDTAAPDPVVDLLHTVDTIVAVSTKVANPKDFPEHLVDGKAETAWNGRTGDLNGFIAFRVPASTRVTRVELTAGFDARGPKGDLFVMNHRITRVRLSREDVVLKEVDLDPAVRTLQGIELDEPGGDFRLEVLATMPGTEKKWRELTVSEFRVWGRRGGAPENPRHLPQMAIGSLDGVRQHAMPSKLDGPNEPFPSVAALCAAWHRSLAPRIDLAFPDSDYPGRIEGPHCKVDTWHRTVPSSTFALGPFLGGTFLDANDVEQEKSRLALQTAAGFTMTNVVLWSRYHVDPGCLHSSHSRLGDVRLLTSPTSKVLVIQILHKDYRWMQVDGSQNGAETLELTYGCRVDSTGAATCDAPLTTGRAKQPLPYEFNPGARDPIDLSATPWLFHREAVLGPAGDLRLGP